MRNCAKHTFAAVKALLPRIPFERPLAKYAIENYTHTNTSTHHVT